MGRQPNLRLYSGPGRRPRSPATSTSFLFLYFSKTFFIEIYFQYHNLQFCTPTTRQGACRPAAGRQGFICKLKKNYLRGSPWREPAAPLRGGRPPAATPGGRPPAATPLGGRGLAARQGAAGSPMLYKRVSLPPPPHLLPTTSREREGERRGEGGSCNGEALPDFGS